MVDPAPDARGRGHPRPRHDPAGRRLPAPLLLAPIGAADLVRRGADLLSAAAAAELGVPYVISSQGCSPMEEVAAAMGDGPRWFQLYWSTDEALVDSLIHRAEAVGAEAARGHPGHDDAGLAATGPRPRHPAVRAGHRASRSTPPTPGSARWSRERLASRRAAGPPDAEVTPRRGPDPGIDQPRSTPARSGTTCAPRSPRAAVEAFLDIYSNPGLSWDHLATLRERTSLPIVLKGILHPDDARRALDLGVSAIVVSNHGGRQVDGAIASLDALPAIRAAVGEGLALILDSGVRTGRRRLHRARPGGGRGRHRAAVPLRPGARRPERRPRRRGQHRGRARPDHGPVGRTQRRRHPRRHAHGAIVPVSMKRSCQLRASPSRCGVCRPQAPAVARST